MRLPRGNLPLSTKFYTTGLIAKTEEDIVDIDINEYAKLWKPNDL